MNWEERWQIVQRIVSERGKNLVKYSFFEKLWEELYGLISREPRSKGGSLLILRAPTGAGKTEATISAYIHHQLKTPSPWFSTIYALPTRSLVFAMARRLSRALCAAGVWPATVTVNYGELLAPTPFLEGDIAVSTYDTLLYAFYGSLSPGYHLLIPMSKISGSLVILDEVQLLQDSKLFALSILPYHVSSLLRSGADVLLMSATIPKVLKDDLTRTARGLANATVCEVESHDTPVRGTLKVQLREGVLPRGEELVKVLGELLSEGGYYPVLIVVNTVEKAVEIYKTLMESKLEAKPLLLHSRLRASTRKSIEELFEDQKQAQCDRSEEKIILVATQVVEAGLDIDVRLLLTELAPVDSLVQRLGRCARKRDGIAIVFKDPDGGRYVYPRCLLDKTLSAVREHEELLELSVSDLRSAQELIDEVYCKSMIDELKKGVSELIDLVSGYIGRTFFETIFQYTTHHFTRKIPLLRLGFELRCIYLIGDLYEKLLKGCGIVLSSDEVRRNLVTISSMGGELPSCVIHEVEGSKIVVTVRLTQRDGEVELSSSPVPLERIEFAELQMRRELLLLNPLYYLSFQGHELGVVKPGG